MNKTIERKKGKPRAINYDKIHEQGNLQIKFKEADSKITKMQIVIQTINGEIHEIEKKSNPEIESIELSKLHEHKSELLKEYKYLKTIRASTNRQIIKLGDSNRYNSEKVVLIRQNINYLNERLLKLEDPIEIVKLQEMIAKKNEILSELYQTIAGYDYR